MINKRLLPIKGHFFLFNAGTAPLVPYMSTYARQLGFSSATVGLIYTVLPITGLIAKPLFGLIADRYKIQKSIFIIFQIVTIVSFLAIYFALDTKATLSVELDCSNGTTVLRSCYESKNKTRECTIDALHNVNETALCYMNCDMTSPKMWQTVCEHWDIPHYCNSDTSNLKYTSYINNILVNDDNCAYISTYSILMDGYNYTPTCHVGDGFVDTNGPCILECSDEKLSLAIGNEATTMTCLENNLNYRLCINDTSYLIQLTTISVDSECKTSCNLDPQKPWRLMEICKQWQAGNASSCYQRNNVDDNFPSNLTLTATVRPSSTFSIEDCVFMELSSIKLPDGSTHYPRCNSKSQYQIEDDLFYASCEINCNHNTVNELFLAAEESEEETSQYTKQFWIFFTLMIMSWIGQAVVVTFADAICFYLLGDDLSLYGLQRLWGSVGWGIFSLLTGALIDLFSDGAYKNYSIAFILMFIFMSGDVAVSSLIKIRSLKFTMSILNDVTALVTSLPIFIYLLWTIAVGLCTGLLWQFLFWHLEDIASSSCDGLNYIKTLQGLVSAIQTFCGEIPFMFVSGYAIKKMGHINMMSLVLFAFGIRFILYSFLTNQWWVLPIEMLQGITFGIFYPTMTSYANSVSPPGTETTVQGLVGAVFEGVGTSLGSFIGGQLYLVHGGWNTFRWFGFGSLGFCLLHIIVQYMLRKRPENMRVIQDKDTADDD